jgi:hypothetical protein
MWASNAWDMTAPEKIMALGGGVFLVGLACLGLLTRLGVRRLPASFAIGGSLLVLTNWTALGDPTAFVVLVLVVLMSALAHSLDNRRRLGWIAVLGIAVIGIAPAVQVGLSHLQTNQTYPVTEAPAAVTAPASGNVEDVVVVIVDSYPSPAIGKSWFGHDSSDLRNSLERRNFQVETAAWGRHTYTPLSIASIVQIQNTVRAGPTKPSMNWSSLYQITRGNNLVANTLRSAGFDYTHIESGWDGTSCGPRVDHCAEAPWIDEQAWQVIAPTAFADSLQDQFFMVSGSFRTAKELSDRMEVLSSNGSHDYLFAHFLLPHVPARVNSRCDLVDHPHDIETDAAKFRAAIADQMSCVDQLLSIAIGKADNDTAVLLAADHGPSTSFQLGLPPEEWSDAAIAERFSIFLAYKIPADCPKPSLPDPLEAMAAIMGCAVEHTFNAPPPEYVIGIDDPVAIDPGRAAHIKDQIVKGLVAPQPAQSIEAFDQGTDSLG